MAHHAKEFAFCSAACLGTVESLTYFCLQFLACGDVVVKSHQHIIRRSELDADFQVDKPPVLAPVSGLEAGPSLCFDFSNVGGDFLWGHNSLQIGDAHCQEFLLAVTAHLAKGCID